MERILSFIVLGALTASSTLAAVGDTFTTANPAEGVYMTFCITSEEAKTCHLSSGKNFESAVVSVGKAVTVPAEVNGYVVTGIGDYAFYSTKGITSVVLPEGITSIGADAFEYCSDLVSVTFPESLTTIGEWAFAYCSSLASVTFPPHMTTLESEAFRGCTSLTSLSIPAGLTDYSSSFWGCTGLASIVVDEDNPVYDSRDHCNAIIRKKDNRLMLGCKNTTIPTGVTVIEMDAFAKCTGLTSIDIPSSVWAISGYAFWGCTGLTSIAIPSSVTTIGYDAFKSCENLTAVHIQDLNSWCGISFQTQDSNPLVCAHHLFLNGEEVMDLVIPGDLTNIGQWAFTGTAFNSVTVKQATPFDINSNVFPEETYQQATLYVPTGRKPYYEDAGGWSNFVHIEEKDMPDVEVSSSPFANVGSRQMILGYYVTDDCLAPGEDGFGGPKGVYKVCIGFDPEKISAFAGNRITHVRFALQNTDLLYPKLWVGNTRDGEHLYEQELPSLTTGWNEVKLDTPFDLTDDSLFVGLEYVQMKANNPHSCLEKMGNESGSCYFYGPYDDGEYMWLDEGKEGLSLSLQCLIEGDVIPQYNVRLSGMSLDKSYYKSGDEVSSNVTVRNWGKKEVAAYVLNFDVDGQTMSTLSSSSSLGRSSSETRYRYFDLPTLSVGKHTVNVSVQSINGEVPSNSAGKARSVVIRVYDKDMGRQKAYLESFTATWCPYVFSTLKKLDVMMTERDDIALVQLHNRDGLSCDAVDDYRVFYSGTPNLNYNRLAGSGATKLTLTYSGSLSTGADEAKAMPSFADVNITADYREADRMLTIHVTGERCKEFLLMEESANLTVLLTEDGIVNPQYDGEQGKYVYDYQHRGVLRTNVSDVWGDPLEWNGDQYEKHYTIQLDEDWVKDNMKVVAFLAKPFTGSNYDEIYVVNCNDFALKDATPVSIADVRADVQDATDVYSVSGVKVKRGTTSVKGLPKGVYIVGGKKVVVR